MKARQIFRLIGAHGAAMLFAAALGVTPALAGDALSKLQEEMNGLETQLNALARKVDKASPTLGRRPDTFDPDTHYTGVPAQQGRVQLDADSKTRSIPKIVDKSSPNLPQSGGAFDPSQHYPSVAMQQGRVQLDADWNEQQAMIDRMQATLARIRLEAGRLQEQQRGARNEAGEMHCRRLLGQLGGLEAALVTLRKAGKDQQEFLRAFGDVRSRFQGARQILIGLLVPAVQRAR